MKRRQLIKAASLGLSSLAFPFSGVEISATEIKARVSGLNQKRLADLALNAARRLGASYCDIRIGHYYTQAIHLEKTQIGQIKNSLSSGFGVRVLVDGVWGFCAHNQFSNEAVIQATQQAVLIAKANKKLQSEPVRWRKQAGVGEQFWQTPIKVDPFNVSLKDKIDLLKDAASKALAAGASYIKNHLYLINQQKYFASSEGSYINQDIYRLWAPFELFAIDHRSGQVATRHGLGAPMGMGFEYLMPRKQDKIDGHVMRYDKSYDLVADAAAGAVEAKQKLRSPAVKPGQYDLIIDPSLLFLVIHETLGHSLELDRILGLEANFAGSSFVDLEAWRRGNMRIGNERVNVFADRIQPGSLGAVKYDDEGTKTGAWPLIQAGEVVGFPTTREYQSLAGNRYAGCSYADSWSAMQIPRMPNVSLAPRSEEYPLESMIRGVDKGLYMLGRGSYSIDQQRNNCQFGGQLCFEIKSGKIIGQVKDVAFQTDTRSLWQNYVSSCDQSDYRQGGSFYDGKGEPVQISAVSHGSASSHFNNIKVINT